MQAVIDVLALILLIVVLAAAVGVVVAGPRMYARSLQRRSTDRTEANQRDLE